MSEVNRWEEFNLIIDTLDLDIKEKGLLLIIFRYVNYKTGYANPSRALLKQLYGTNKNDVIDKVLNSLIKKGYLYRESGKGIRSKYFLKLGTKIEPSTQVEPSSIVEPILGTEIEPILGTRIEPQKENKKKTKENIYSSNDSEDIWKLYPNKKGKAKSITYINKILKSISKEELIRCITRYKQDVENQRSNGFKTLAYKNGSTFFNGGYIDYLDENYQEDNKDIEKVNNVQVVSIEELIGGRV